MSTQERLLTSVISKWESIEIAIESTVLDYELKNYINNIKETLQKMKESELSNELFDDVERYFILLESRVDEMLDNREISRKLWELINCSLYNFIEFVSYLKVSNKINQQ
jgi:hypothetical protein